MKRAAALGSLWLAVAVAACGPSQIVLTVDVLSFLRADSLDAFSFGVRGGVRQTGFTVSLRLSLPTPLGPGYVDYVAVTAGAILEVTHGGCRRHHDGYFAFDQPPPLTCHPYLRA